MQDGGSANINSSKNAMEPCLAFFNNIPYVAWREDNGTTYQTCVKHWTGSNWAADAYSLNADSAQWANSPQLVIASNGNFYVAWSEGATTSDIFARRFTGTVWSAASGGLKINTGYDAVYPAMTLINDIPYLAWKEYQGGGAEIHVKKWNGSGWESFISAGLTSNAFQYSPPSIAGSGGTLYVAWDESPGPTIVVKHWNGVAWVQDGGVLNVNAANAAYSPSMAVYNGTPYVAWSEYYGTSLQIYVKHWNGSAWVQDGGSLNVNPAQGANKPKIAFVNGRPYVVWFESASKSQLYMKHWNGSAWVQDGGSFNVNPSLDDFGLSLAVSAGGVPYAAFNEDPGTVPLDIQVYLKHYVAPTSTPIPTPNFTRTPTPIPSSAPRSFLRIYNNQINPNRGEQAVIRWSQPETGPVRIVVCNMLRDKVVTLVDGQVYAQGQFHDVPWKGLNQAGSPVGSGIYLVVLQAGNDTQWAKVAVVK